MAKYIFESARLGFRNWKSSDVSKMININSDPKVMEFFPSIPTAEQTKDFIKRMQQQFAKNGFCYFAVDKLETKEFIGFIGISEQNFEADFTPCVDIGWRLSQKYWGKGYATEGAKKCLEVAFEQLNLQTIKSICPVINEKSERVMTKLGMKKVKEFKHPLLSNFKNLEIFALYQIEKQE